MGYKSITLKLPTSFHDGELRKKIANQLKIRNFSFQIENKSLDARNKSNIHWLLTIAVHSDEIKGGEDIAYVPLEIPLKDRKENILVVGNGPAGFFCGFVLQRAGYEVTMIDRGYEVEKRDRSIELFEKEGVFNPLGNYAFGEGGAGTFSDGKLTSRSKHISKERQFILDSYISAGAPKEIAYMAHPHLGTDNLKLMVKKMRHQFIEAGGKMMFETLMTDISVKNGKVVEVMTNKGNFNPDKIFIAPGHSAYDTYRMLMRNGVLFRTKNFALGSRMEHRQEIINMAQWGRPALPGVKAAEYRLTSNADNQHQVYSFCMCPGGMVVPAAAIEGTNIVNGMSYYLRDGRFANAACVAGIHPDSLAEKAVSPTHALDLVEQLERSFFYFTGNYTAPACRISDFIDGKITNHIFESSFPLGLQSAPLWEMLPIHVSSAMKAGLLDFSRKMKNFETGILIGLESKTSSPVQVIREEDGRCSGFSNLYLIGEGSGYAGGIISSAADGVKIALKCIMEEKN
jgi:uncharacterized protein